MATTAGAVPPTPPPTLPQAIPFLGRPSDSFMHQRALELEAYWAAVLQATASGPDGGSGGGLTSWLVDALSLDTAGAAALYPPRPTVEPADAAAFNYDPAEI